VLCVHCTPRGHRSAQKDNVLPLQRWIAVGWDACPRGCAPATSSALQRGDTGPGSPRSRWNLSSGESHPWKVANVILRPLEMGTVTLGKMGSGRKESPGSCAPAACVLEPQAVGEWCPRGSSSLHLSLGPVVTGHWGRAGPSQEPVLIIERHRQGRKFLWFPAWVVCTRGWGQSQARVCESQC
jgi:hypothetical protein